MPESYMLLNTVAAIAVIALISALCYKRKAAENLKHLVIMARRYDQSGLENDRIKKELNKKEEDRRYFDSEVKKIVELLMEKIDHSASADKKETDEELVLRLEANEKALKLMYERWMDARKKSEGLAAETERNKENFQKAVEIEVTKIKGLFY